MSDKENSKIDYVFNAKCTTRNAQRMTHNAQRIAIAFVCVSLFCSGLEAQDEQWNIKKGKHFIIYYQEGSRQYLSKVASKAEHYYKSITNYLGLRRFDFWTWQKRCKIYLYPGRGQYLAGSRRASWSKGSVHVIRKEIFTYTGKEEFLDYVLPHELGHIIFREVVGFDKQLPLWIDEGVALLQEKDRQRYLEFAVKLVKKGNYLSLDDLSRIRGYQNIDPAVFYSQSASMIEFLLEKFGRKNFVAFCRCLRDGKEWKKALIETYGYDDLEEIERAWVSSLMNY